MLLLLDNCEHLVAACAQRVQQWLRHSPHLHILATSREPLHLLGEQRFPVAPLAAATASELFVQRARLVDPAFTCTDANRAAIDQLCQQVDYLPLAIELLAARSDLFSPQAMLERLQARPLDLLSAELRNLPARQRTLRHTIQHSYDLLNAREQALFRTLSVFAGGFDLSAISYMGFDEETLYALVNRSMAQSEAEYNGARRFRLLETLRICGSELLTANQEESAVRKLHATYYIQLVETVELALRGPRMKTHLAQLETEYNNVRAALAWAQEGGENTTALRFCGALWRFWLIHGRLREGKIWIDKFISVTSAVPICIRAKALIAAGNIELIIGQNAYAQALFKQSLELYYESGDKLGIASTLMELANALRYDNDYKRIPILCTQSLRLYQEIEDMWGIAVVHTLLGYTAMNEQGDCQTARVYFTYGLTLQRQVGDYIWIIHALHGLAFVAIQFSEYQTAVTHYEEVLALSRELKDMHSVAVALNDLGSTMLHQQNYAQATSYFAESFALAQKLCYPSLIRLTLNNQGNMAFQRGDFALAKQYYNQSLIMAHQIGDRLGIAGQLESLAHIAQAYGQAQKTVKLLSATECLRRSIGVPLPASHRSRQQTLIAIVLSQLGQIAFDSVWTEGQALTLNAAIALALEDPH